MDGRPATIGDHPALQPRKREPILGWSLLAEAVALLWCSAFGSPVLLTGPYDFADRTLWLVMGIVIAWVCRGFLVSNRRALALRERLLAREISR